MPLTLHELARYGAVARLAEIDAERVLLLQAFPDLAQAPHVKVAHTRQSGDPVPMTRHGNARLDRDQLMQTLKQAGGPVRIGPLAAQFGVHVSTLRRLLDQWEAEGRTTRTGTHATRSVTWLRQRSPHLSGPRRTGRHLPHIAKDAERVLAFLKKGPASPRAICAALTLDIKHGKYVIKVLTENGSIIGSGQTSQRLLTLPGTPMSRATNGSGAALAAKPAAKPRPPMSDKLKRLQSRLMKARWRNPDSRKKLVDGLKTSLQQQAPAAPVETKS